jgi:hypothetical protein
VQLLRFQVVPTLVSCTGWKNSGSEILSAFPPTTRRGVDLTRRQKLQRFHEYFNKFNGLRRN